MTLEEFLLVVLAATIAGIIVWRFAVNFDFGRKRKEAKSELQNLVDDRREEISRLGIQIAYSTTNTF